MSVILAFDIGLAHTGVAISYEGQIAQGLTTIHTNSIDRLQGEILSLVQKYQPDSLVIGIPTRGPINEVATNLQNYLESSLDIPIKLVNEDLSSQVAQKALISANAPQKKRRLHDHQAAAASILQLYLDDLVE